MLLGEARSKVEHIEGVPLLPEVAQELHSVFLAKGVNATTAIEGNTLSEEQVRMRLDGKLQLPPSQEYLQQEIDNVLEAVNLIGKDLVASGPKPFTVEMIQSFNRLVLKHLPLPDEVVPGRLRTHPVGVGNYRGAPAEDCEFLLERLVEWLNGQLTADVEVNMVHAIIRAVLAHLYLAWIHPFGDGNGRTSRLVEFQILVSAGVPFPAAHLLSNHYNLTRAEYYRHLEASSRSSDPIPFLTYAVRGFVDGLRQQLRLIWGQQMDLAWEHLVYGRFRDAHSPTSHRRRTLLLRLGEEHDPVPTAKIRRLSPELAETYAGKTVKTLTRDLNALEAMHLIRRDGGGWRANLDIVVAFLPAKVHDPDVSGLPPLEL